MAVSNCETCGSVPVNYRVIAAYLHLLDGIDNFFPAIAVFVQIVKGSCPVIAAAECQCLLGFLAIRQQLHSNFRRPQAVLIARIVPCLCHGNAGLLRRVGVGHIEAVHRGGIAQYSILSNGIKNFFTIRVLRQAGKAPFPVILGGYGHVIHLLAIGIETDGDGIGAFSVLIVFVIPCLGAGNRNGLRRITVGDGEAPGRRFGDIGCISVYRPLLYGVVNLLAIQKFIQIFKGTLPTIRFTQSQRLAC